MNDCEKVAQKESPIEGAMAQLKNNIGKVQETITRFETLLAAVINQPEEKPSTTAPTETQAAPQTPLESRLNSMASDIREINVYLREVQNRIQL